MSSVDDKDKKNRSGRNPFDIDGLDDLMKNIFGEGFRMPDFGFGTEPFMLGPEGLGNGKSISYRFSSDMDKPEIRINGKPVDIDEEQLKKMMSGGMRPESFDFQPQQIPTLDAGEIELEKNPIDASGKSLPAANSVKSAEYEEPYSEIYINDARDSVTITVELPSVMKERIIINHYDNNVTITGESEDRLYRKRFELPFKPDKEKTEIDGRNGIFEIKLTK